MPQIGTWLLANVFSALLPPNDPEERDFYEILGIFRDSTNEQIRKAYKVKSLQLHPDKVAQRGTQNPQEAAAEYEKVQEAHGVLVNDEKRQRYHALNCSPTRYRFVAQGAMANTGALYENLTGASFVDKTRLVVLCSIMVMVVLMQPILIATKINHSLEEQGGLEATKWTILLMPTWILGAIYILFWMVMIPLAPAPARLSVLLMVLEYLCWYIAVFFLALQWDGTWDKPYRQVLTPIYVAMAFKWIQSMMILQKIRRDVGRMVSVDYLEKEVLKGKSLEDMSEEEREHLRNAFIVVTVPPEFEPDLEEGQELENSEKAVEEQKVEASPEYEAATDIYNSTFGGLVGSLVFGLVFIILLTLRLDNQIDANWWTVFIPIWIYFGSRWFYSCFRSCCATVSGDEVLIQMEMPAGEEEGNTADDKESNDSEDRPSTDGFVDPQTSISKFNKSERSKETKGEKPKEDGKAKSDKATSSDEKEKTSKKKSEKTEAETEEKPAAAAAEAKETSIEVKKSDKVDDVATKDSGDKEDGNSEKENNDDEDDDGIHIDEETFRAWQSAYDEAERGAMKEQAKAATDCCNLSVKIMLLCLMVAKIEKNYDNDDPDNVGFNTFWILFPFLLFFGIVFCCCACLIYGAAPGDASDLHEPHPAGEEEDVENPTSAASSPVIVMEPTNADTATGANSNTPGIPPKATASAEDKTEDSENAKKVEEEENIEDLD